MATSKKQGKFGIARSASASAEVSAPEFVITCESANITRTPARYRRIVNSTRQLLGQETAGFDYAFSVSGAEMSADQVGYLMWMFLGAQSVVTSLHTLVLATDELPEYCNVFIDRGLDLGSSTPTEKGIGGIITSIRIEAAPRGFAKVSISGLLVNKGTPVAALTVTEPASADDMPISWKALRTGDFTIGYNDGVEADDTTIKSLALEFTNEAQYSELDLSSDQPSDIDIGDLGVMFELTRNFDGATALAEYNAVHADQEIGITAKFTTGSNHVQFEIPNAKANEYDAGEVGTGLEKITAAMTCEAHKVTGVEILTVEVENGSTDDYS